MIDHNLPEPPEESRHCVYCGKKRRLMGVLIHWPFCHADKHGYDKPVKMPNSNIDVEPFSAWSYVCAWCRAIETKRKQKSLS